MLLPAETMLVVLILLHLMAHSPAHLTPTAPLSLQASDRLPLLLTTLAFRVVMVREGSVRLDVTTIGSGD